jgi:predicted  nucleic acid-binding Zn-ribbon protein
LASAESLKMTNDKINKLLSDEAIMSLQTTFKNSEQLTAQASKVLAHANSLFSTTSQDLHTLVASTQHLTNNVVAVSQNINEVVGDPKLKANIMKTVDSIEQSSTALNNILQDPALKLLISDAQVTSQNAAQLMTYLRQTAVDNDLQGRLNESLTLLNSSLVRLNTVMGDVETVTGDKASLQSIIQETRETSQNLNRFSERLNKRFLLFRLLF